MTDRILSYWSKLTQPQRRGAPGIWLELTAMGTARIILWLPERDDTTSHIIRLGQMVLVAQGESHLGTLARYPLADTALLPEDCQLDHDRNGQPLRGLCLDLSVLEAFSLGRHPMRWHVHAGCCSYRSQPAVFIIAHHGLRPQLTPG